ncbi:MAG: HypC/HybG/HupF family hydrogenase formation chaperone [Rhodocyclaceae bacterium]|jgi:hydrogenase expression/formation protein HypC|nr:HypC/HybG/HupF family hydrogenase formation chaperone [Rhodocyclaceae bacterium]
MCLAIPARVIEMPDEETAIVDLGGVKKAISLALVEDVTVGDYVIVHVGFALNKLDPEEAERTLALFAEMGELVAAQDGVTAAS